MLVLMGRANFYQLSIQSFSKIAVPATSKLKTRSSMVSSASAVQIVVEYNGVDDGGGRSGDFDMTFQVICWRSKHCSFIRKSQ